MEYVTLLTSYFTVSSVLLSYLEVMKLLYDKRNSWEMNSSFLCPLWDSGKLVWSDNIFDSTGLKEHLEFLPQGHVICPSNSSVKIKYKTLINTSLPLPCNNTIFDFLIEKLCFFSFGADKRRAAAAMNGGRGGKVSRKRQQHCMGRPATVDNSYS